MPNPKFKKYFDEMFKENQEKMMKFMILNQDYRSNKVKFSEDFNQQGQEIKNIVEDSLDRLCKQMEKGQYANYSNKLADKFLEEVTKYFPYYHEIGVNVR